MTDTEIEHVARAICAAMGQDPDKRLQFDPTQIVDPPVMLRTPQPAWTFYAVQARAHIAAFNALAETTMARMKADERMFSAEPAFLRPKAHKSGPKAGED